MRALASLLMSCVLAFTVAGQNRSVLKQPCPNERGWTGKYRNYVFGFSLVIPRGLTGYWNSGPCTTDERYGCVCLNDHGRVIPLSDGAHIEAFVSYQMESEWSVRDHERQEIFYLKTDKGNRQINIVRSEWVRLSSLRARRFEARYLHDGKPAVTDHIVALHDGVEYELVLVTSPDRYEVDRQQFEKVISSWRLTRRV
jgi:hypothetical protein